MQQERKNILQGSVTGVSLGPGDPKLITVKGLELLKKADKVYYPGSRFQDGRRDSFSLPILQQYRLDPAKLIGFYLKMSLDREEAIKLYKATSEQIKEDFAQGLHIVVVSEGDASTYSSFSYLLLYLRAAGISVDVVPGITSYALAAACQKAPLCLQNEKMLLLPRVQCEEELLQCLRHHDTVVLMKIRSVLPIIIAVLETNQLSFFYGERLGTEKAFTCSDLSVLKERKVPYFSLMIIKKAPLEKTKPEPIGKSTIVPQ